jgi:hypothetical protein
VGWSATAHGQPKQPTRPRLELLNQLKHRLETITLPTAKTDWSGYYDPCFYPLTPCDAWTEKHHGVYDTLRLLKPSSVLDIGSNRGWYAQLAASMGSAVVAFDVDSVCIDRLFEDARERRLPILPLVMDFRNPTPGYGLCDQRLAAATQRLKCELMMVLALVHHLVFKEQLSFEQIVQAASVFAGKWLLIEFIPREDQFVREWWSERYSWYTLENFQQTLKRHYSNVRIVSTTPEPRMVLLCER